MSEVNIGSIRTFPNVKLDKAQAMKPLEEAAEVFAEWQKWDGGIRATYVRTKLLEECADVIVAVCNLAKAFDCDDLAPFISHVERKNEERGRYE